MPSREELAGLPAAVSAPQPPIAPALLRGFIPRQDAHPRRVAFWGDSHLAAGFFQDELTRILRRRGIAATPAYLPPTMGRPGVRLPLRKFCLSPRWEFQPAYLADASATQVGPALATLKARTPGSYLWLDLRDAQRRPLVRTLQLLYRPDGRGAAVTVSVDGGRNWRLRLPARRKVTGPATIQISADKAISTLKLRVAAGHFDFQGVRLAPVREPEMSLDVFAFPSATARGWAQLDPVYLRASLAGLEYDALVLAYGTNEGNVEPFNPTHYTQGLERALLNLRVAFPEASCLLMGPTDRGALLPRARRGEQTQERSARLLHYARVHRRIAEIQRRVGARYQCASWDWQAHMGGQGSAYRWAMSEPALAARDLTHLTPTGYHQTARAVARLLGWETSPAPSIPFEPRPLSSHP